MSGVMVGPFYGHRNAMTLLPRLIRTTSLTATALLSLSPLASYALDCQQAHATANAKGGDLHPRAGYVVKGQGRLQFYSAPAMQCAIRGKFVIPGDHLIAYTKFKDWYWVMYINPKTGDDVEAWVKGDRLEFVGTEGPG